jgi:hypothetical protein
MARTSSKKGKPQPPLLTGPVRAYKDNAAGQIVVETTKFNLAGSDLEVCRLEMGRAADARMIVALPSVMKFAEAFAVLGQRLEGADADAILITHEMAAMEITVGEAQNLAKAWISAFPPVTDGPAYRVPRGAKPRPPH